MSNQILLRSLLFVPGHNEKLIDSASKSDADALLFDLEDSVMPESNKSIARQVINHKIKNKEFDKFLKYVRVNEIKTSYFLQDIIQLTVKNIDGFLLSKTDTHKDVIYLDYLLTSIEREKGFELGKFKIIPILESAKSIVNINKIAKSSKRIIALGFGSEDYVSDIQGIRDFDTNISISHPRSLVPIVSRSHGLEAIDAAYIKVHDIAGLKDHALIGKTLGYSGMWCLHPKQNDIVNTIYSPTQQEYEESLESLELYKEAKLLNKGVAIIKGKFIGPPVITKSKAIIAKYENIHQRKHK